VASPIVRSTVATSERTVSATRRRVIVTGRWDREWVDMAR
jgi:hypothetical protein